MTRFLLVLASAAALAGPALAKDSASPLHKHPMVSRMTAHPHPIHCTIRHHKRYCHR
jgi:hypothetical protein